MSDIFKIFRRFFQWIWGVILTYYFLHSVLEGPNIRTSVTFHRSIARLHLSLIILGICYRTIASSWLISRLHPSLTEISVSFIWFLCRSTTRIVWWLLGRRSSWLFWLFFGKTIEHLFIFNLLYEICNLFDNRSFCMVLSFLLLFEFLCFGTFWADVCIMAI